jgi:hypothetical protein
MLVNYRVAAQLVVSRVVLSFTQLVSFNSRGKRSWDMQLTSHFQPGNYIRSYLVLPSFYFTATQYVTEFCISPCDNHPLNTLKGKLAL